MIKLPQDKSRLLENRSKHSSNKTREAINWWNTLTYPQRSEAKHRAYPTKTSVQVSDEEKVHIHSVLFNKLQTKH